MTFSGAGVVGGSIADGDYDITVVSTAVHANSQTMTNDVTNTFYRLFGDTNGAGQVSGRPDLVAMQMPWARRSGKRITWPTWTTTGTASSPVGRISRISSRVWVSFTRVCQPRFDVPSGGPLPADPPSLRETTTPILHRARQGCPCGRGGLGYVLSRRENNQATVGRFFPLRKPLFGPETDTGAATLLGNSNGKVLRLF